ncbi:MAG: type II toxin-antitoxin system RelE/ParE family toxin [Puia sp.]|nr:type II toxin-antitoxin system RelE/ParE family toxin [Puia sp.]
MNYGLVVQSEAVIEIQEAFEWYERRRAGLGFALIEELEEGFERLSKHPQHYTAINQKYRRLRVKRFPYLIVYEIKTDTVIIIAVRRMSQEQKF